MKITAPGTPDEVPRRRTRRAMYERLSRDEGYYKNEEATNEVIDEDG
ncbi:hypothetical protein ACEQPO_15570 [Bacillus sp. SL00103]